MTKQFFIDAVFNPFGTFGYQDSMSSQTNYRNRPYDTESIKIGTVEQFNVGMYSALVSTDKYTYVCYLGAYNATTGFGYSDSIVLNEGDKVLFAVLPGLRTEGMVLAKVPTPYAKDEDHDEKVKSDSDLERRTHFFSNDCYRKKSPAYDNPLKTPTDISTGRYLCNRPTDLVPGEAGMLNPHRNGFLNNMYSTSIVGGGAHIRLFSLENKIRVVADSIVKHTLFGNDAEWHNRRYLSKERTSCIYQEERLGVKQRDTAAFTKSDYHEDGYFIKNKKKKQTLIPRILEQEGYFGGLSAKYYFRPDPDSGEIRTMDEKVKEAGVARESVDPSGQYRLATTGMLGLERIGRIPVPVRIMYPWHKDAKTPPGETLTEFQHDEDHPYYRQLELADRVAYDLKNSYSRLDESKEEFYVPDEKDLKSKVKDVYDGNFTSSTTVKLEKYDKRRSGIWQGEDGSIILRDAWGSEIVMIGGNIQFSCAGNIEILPGKSALTLAGDDAIVKAQNSVDVESADKDVRINAFKNVQVMAGVDENNPGGIILEANGTAQPWDGKSANGGEEIRSSGILLKAHDGNVVTDTKNAVLKADRQLSLIAGDKTISGGKGKIMVSADSVQEHGKSIMLTTDNSTLMLNDSAILTGSSTIVASTDSTSIFNGTKLLIPLMWIPTGFDIANEIMENTQPVKRIMVDEEKVAMGYSSEKLEKMVFKFRSSEECGTESSWEVEGSDAFTLFEPFWVQVRTKFETLKSVNTAEFEDHKDSWPDYRGNPWPGKTAVTSGKYAKLADDHPVNMDDDGFNKARKEVQDTSPVTEVDLFPGYLIRK